MRMQQADSSLEELRRRVFGRQWFHQIDLGNGIVTPGIDKSTEKLKHFRIPERLDGMSVLDVGAFDGFFSFECERRGAKRVVAADHFCWSLTGMNTKQGFDLAKAALASRVEDVDISVEDITPERLGSFDLVLFLGVLYHSQDPMSYLRIVRSVCRRLLILETHVDTLDYPRPAMVFYPGKTLNGDATNFWGPNILAVRAMLEEVGFREVRHVCTYDGVRAVFHASV